MTQLNELAALSSVLWLLCLTLDVWLCGWICTLSFQIPGVKTMSREPSLYPSYVLSAELESLQSLRSQG